MKTRLFGALLCLLVAQSAIAENLDDSSQVILSPQPTTCVVGTFSSTGNDYWRIVLLKITNNCTAPVDFQNSSITFMNRIALSTRVWGDFEPLSYPDNTLEITSQKTDEYFLTMLNLHFPNYPGANSKLPPGGSFSVRYGAAAEEHVGPVNAYLAGPSLNTGTLSLKNTTTKPADVPETYVMVRLTSNGQNVSNIELPWNSTKNIGPLASGAYTISADNVKGENGSVYEATVNPSSVNVKTDEVVTSSIQYKALQQFGSVGISLRALPSQLSGYDGKPTVVLSESNGSSSSATLEWNALTTVGQLKNGSSYKLSTNAINYNNFQCQPTFKPASLIAGATAPKSTLSYACTSTAQNRVTLKVQGAPASLSQLKVTLIPNNNSIPTTQAIPLAGGNGSIDLQLPNGVAYTVSMEQVNGYTVHFSQQPLVSSANAVETITFTSTANGTPVSINGQLKVCGTKLCNKDGVPFQLKGLSTHGLQWYGWNKCITPSSLDALAKDFKANVIRVSLYVQEGGYETNPTGFTQQMNQIITEASARGMYVIVDWHMLNPGDPNFSLELAKTFFTSIANSHKDRENILYEIANEPSGVSWSAIKSYAEKIIPVIRGIDANAPILVGTRAWSSLGVSEGGNSNEMISSPVNASNIMYTFHFYAASHKDEYLKELDKASTSLPIFVTEFGTQTHTGDGGDDFIMSEKYLKLMADKKMSWTSWNYSDDIRSGAVWKTGTCSKGAWVDSSLKPAGVWIKNKIKN